MCMMSCRLRVSDGTLADPRQGTATTFVGGRIKIEMFLGSRSHKGVDPLIEVQAEALATTALRNVFIG